MTNTAIAPGAAPAEFGPGPVQTPPVSHLGVALRLLIAFVAGMAAYGPALLLTGLPGMDARPDALAGNWWLALLKQAGPLLTIPLLAVALIAAAARWLDGRPFAVTGIRFDRRWLGSLLLGTGVSLAIVVPAGVLLGRLGLVEVYPINANEPVWVAVVYVLVLGYVMQGLTEEFVWRGWLSQSIGGGRHRQAVITSIGFGLIHILSNGGHANFWEGAVYVTSAAAFGYAACALYFATGSIWAAVGIHGGLHLANYLAQSLGGGEGWPLELVQIALYGLIGFAVMRRLPAGN
jgi:membrane protease YdiL (CAAX protease family)